MSYVIILEILAGIALFASFLPRLGSVLMLKKVDEVSSLTYLLLCFGVGLWMVYAYIKNDYILLFTNFFIMCIGLGVLVLRYKFMKKHKHH